MSYIEDGKLAQSTMVKAKKKIREAEANVKVWRKCMKRQKVKDGTSVG